MVSFITNAAAGLEAVILAGRIVSTNLHSLRRGLPRVKRPPFEVQWIERPPREVEGDRKPPTWAATSLTVLAAAVGSGNARHGGRQMVERPPHELQRVERP